MVVIPAQDLLEAQKIEQLRLEEQEAQVLKDPKHLEERDQLHLEPPEEVPLKRMEEETKEPIGLESPAIIEGLGQAAIEASKMEAEKTIETVEERGSLKLEAEEVALTVFLRPVLMLALEQMLESSSLVSMDAQRDVPNLFYSLNHFFII